TDRPQPALRKGGRRRVPAAFYWHPCSDRASPVWAHRRQAAGPRGPSRPFLQRPLVFLFARSPARVAMTQFTALRLALFQPDIAPNTATILRLCACLGVEAHIIEPAGFPVSDRAFAAPAWIISRRSLWCGTSPGTHSRHGGRERNCGSSCCRRVRPS